MSFDVIWNVEQIIINTHFFMGLIVAILLSCLINLFMGHIRNNEDWNLSEGNSINNEIFRRSFRLYSPTPNIWLLGTLEVISYYIAIYFSYEQLIIVWLTFKVASKWNTWSTIAKIPDHLQNVNGFDYLEAKNKVATITLQRWLLGNLLNILGAICSILLSFWLFKLFSSYKDYICI